MLPLQAHHDQNGNTDAATVSLLQSLQGHKDEAALLATLRRCADRQLLVSPSCLHTLSPEVYWLMHLAGILSYLDYLRRCDLQGLSIYLRDHLLQLQAQDAPGADRAADAHALAHAHAHAHAMPIRRAGARENALSPRHSAFSVHCRTDVQQGAAVDMAKFLINEVLSGGGGGGRGEGGTTALCSRALQLVAFPRSGGDGDTDDSSGRSSSSGSSTEASGRVLCPADLCAARAVLQLARESSHERAAQRLAADTLHSVLLRWLRAPLAVDISSTNTSPGCAAVPREFTLLLSAAAPAALTDALRRVVDPAASGNLRTLLAFGAGAADVGAGAAALSAIDASLSGRGCEASLGCWPCFALALQELAGRSGHSGSSSSSSSSSSSNSSSSSSSSSGRSSSSSSSSNGSSSSSSSSGSSSGSGSGEGSWLDGLPKEARDLLAVLREAVHAAAARGGSAVVQRAVHAVAHLDACMGGDRELLVGWLVRLLGGPACGGGAGMTMGTGSGVAGGGSAGAVSVEVAQCVLWTLVEYAGCPGASLEALRKVVRAIKALKSPQMPPFPTNALTNTNAITTITTSNCTAGAAASLWALPKLKEAAEAVIAAINSRETLDCLRDKAMGLASASAPAPAPANPTLHGCHKYQTPFSLAAAGSKQPAVSVASLGQMRRAAKEAAVKRLVPGLAPAVHQQVKLIKRNRLPYIYTNIHSHGLPIIALSPTLNPNPNFNPCPPAGGGLPRCARGARQLHCYHCS